MISTTVEDGYRTITLDRPESRNALTPAGMKELEEVVETASEPVLYVCGAGEAFCAGADLSVVESLDSDSAAAMVEGGQEVMRTIATYDGVVVAGVDGPARGGGVELGLACDLRVATPRATFAESGVKLGLFGAWGGTVRLPRIVGEGNAMDLFVSGRVVDATEARRVGLVSRVVETPESVAASIATHDPMALRRVKHRVRDTDGTAEQERREREAFAELIGRRSGDGPGD